MQASLKHYWAGIHAYSLSQIWEAGVKDHFHAASGGEVQTGYRLEENLFTPPLPWQVLVHLGDCIRNLRSSLDYLVSEMARRKGLDDSQTIFPFARLRSGLEASFNEPRPGDEHRKGRKAGALYELSGQYPDLKNIILEDIQPYSADDGARSSGDLLWRLITADNIDKHRLITPTVQHADCRNVRIVPGDMVIENVMMMSSGVIGLPQGSRLDKKSEIAVDIVFKEPATLAGKPVTGTLIEVIEATRHIIELFSEKFPA